MTWLACPHRKLLAVGTGGRGQESRRETRGKEEPGCPVQNHFTEKVSLTCIAKVTATLTLPCLKV